MQKSHYYHESSKKSNYLVHFLIIDDSKPKYFWIAG